MNEFDKQNHDLWKWGSIYYNPNDPAVWVEKRCGLGWTVNFAHKLAYVYIVLALIVPLLLVIWAKS